MASTAEHLPSNLQDLSSRFEEFTNHDWDTDENFKSGLAAILGPSIAPEQVEELTLRARCFYFSRTKNIPIDYDEYIAWEKQKESGTTVSVNNHAPTPTVTDVDTGPKFSYQEIVEMIQSGKPIPGIKDIPNTILEGQGTTSAQTKRRKPWEKDEPAKEATAVAKDLTETSTT